ncbi:MAG: SGNH/GDSL hydrolase family protein [Cyanobacteria bacterium]|nr:SGNH/GDSL hydrolase family protein [Cyanobacteriota bacterium]
MARKNSSNAHNLYKELYCFGSSLISYGDYAAYLQKTVLASTALPAWSAVTFSNANFGCQLGLRDQLGIKTDSVTPPEGLGLPSTFYSLANPYVSIPSLGTLRGTSFAIGGATSSTVSLYDVITIPVQGGNVPLSTVFPKLAQTGVQNQILAALREGVKPASNELSLIEGGANDLLIAYINQVADIEGVLDQVMANMRENLTVQLRAGDSRQLMSFTLAGFRGKVDGVLYEMPFLSSILLQASQPDAPDWIKNWKSFVENDGLEKFQADYKIMLTELNEQFPYAAITYFDPDFGASWKAYGSKLGNFGDYGIDKTFSYAQLTAQPLSEEQTNGFLYLDNIHNCASGQAMTARAMSLTLEANRSAIEAARLEDQKIGSEGKDRLQATRLNTLLSGLGGDDILIGRQGNDVFHGGRGEDRLLGDRGRDWLQGGEGSDRLTGGLDADFFAWEARDADGAWTDKITDFKGNDGDRLGINAVLDGDNPFQNQGWTYIGRAQFSGAAAELRFSNGLLQGDVNGDRTSDLNIQMLNVNNFNPSWIS